MALDLDHGYWECGWEPGDVPQTRFAWTPHDLGDWVGDAYGFGVRDLGLGAASTGLISAVELRRDPGRPQSAMALATSDFRFLFVLEGSATLRSGNRLGRWSSAAGARARGDVVEETSDDFRAVSIQVPVGGDAQPDAPIALSSGVLTHDRPSAYSRDGLRSYLSYRDLETRELTSGRVHIHVVRSAQAVSGGTGWHAHTMSQWVYVLSGSGTVRVSGQQGFRMVPGDCMCLAPGLGHDVSEFSDDYAVLEMCLPADYETTTVATP